MFAFKSNYTRKCEDSHNESPYNSFFTLVCDIDIILFVVNKRIIFCFAIINVRYQEEKHGRESTYRPDLRCGR